MVNIYFPTKKNAINFSLPGLCLLVLISLYSCIDRSNIVFEYTGSERLGSTENLSKIVRDLTEREVSGYVLIYYSTPEYSSLQHARQDTSASKSVVRLDTENCALHSPDSIKLESRYNWGSPFICRKVIEDHGDVIEVLTLDDAYNVPEKIGHGGLGADYMFELTTYIRKIDLVPVLGNSFKLTYPDSTYIQLDPGVAVGTAWYADETSRAVSIRELHFPWMVPDSLLALSYHPILRSSVMIEGQKMLDENALLILGGQRLFPVSEIRLSRLRTPASFHFVGNQLIVELSANGIHMKVKTNLGLVDNYIPDINRPTLSNRFKTPPRWYYRIKEGMPVYWENGELAGKVRQYFGYQSETGPGEKIWCERISELFPDKALCFKINDLVVIDNKKH